MVVMKNRYGVDISYFQGKLSQVIVNLDNYTPAELARELARLSVTADESVILNEDEFNWNEGD